MVTQAPSYTSGAHIWKGAADNLNNKEIVIKIFPTSPLNNNKFSS